MKLESRQAVSEALQVLLHFGDAEVHHTVTLPLLQELGSQTTSPGPERLRAFHHLTSFLHQMPAWR